MGGDFMLLRMGVKCFCPNLKTVVCNAHWKRIRVFVWAGETFLPDTLR